MTKTTGMEDDRKGIGKEKARQGRKDERVRVGGVRRTLLSGSMDFRDPPPISFSTLHTRQAKNYHWPLVDTEQQSVEKQRSRVQVWISSIEPDYTTSFSPFHGSAARRR